MKNALKKWITVVCVIVLAATAQARSTIGTNEETERKKLSVLLLVDGAVSAVEKQPIPSQSIYREIETDKHRHQERRNSYELSQVHVEKRLKSNLKQSIHQIFNASGFDKIDPDWCREMEKQALEKADIPIAANLSLHFDDSFTQARSKIVTEQQADLIQIAKPQTRQDYVKVEKQSPSLNKDLLDRSTNKFKEPIFSENADYLSKKIDEIILDARQQYNAQRHIVSNTRGGGFREITVKSIQKAIHGEIEQYRSSLKNPYDIFPSVEKSIPLRSKSLTMEKFETWSDALDLRIPESRIREIIEADVNHHRQKTRSRELLLQNLLPEIQRTITNDYTKPLPPGDRRRLIHFLEEQPSYYVQLERAAEKSLKEFSHAREAIGQEQFERTFPELADESWKPDGNTIQRRYNRDIGKDDQRISQSFLSGKSVLEETQVLVEQAIHRLAAKGDSALKHQMALVEGYRVEAEKNPQQLFMTIPDSEMGTDIATDKVVEIATSEIRKRWSETPLSKDYPLLFESVEDQIRKEVKDLLPIEMVRRKATRPVEKTKHLARAGIEADSDRHEDGLEVRGEGKKSATFLNSARKADGKTAAASKGGKTGQTGMQDLRSRKKGKTSATVLIDINIESEKIVIATVEIDGTDSFTFTFPLGRENTKAFHALVVQQLEKFDSRIKGYFRHIPEASPLRFVYGVTRIFHARVPYGLVFDLRERFRRAATSESSKKLSLFWYDGFFSEKKPIDKSEIKKRCYRLLPAMTRQ